MLLPLLLLVQMRSGGITGQSLTPSPKASPETPATEVIVSENTAVVYFSPSHEHPNAVTSFVIRSRAKQLQDVEITSTGLGRVTFALDQPGGSDLAGQPGTVPADNKTCPEGSTQQTPCLRLRLLDQAGQKVRVALPGSLVPQPGSSVAGKILIFAPQQKPVEVPLKVERPASDPIWTAAQWFLGITIPAVLTFLLGYAASRLTNWRSLRQEQLNQFNKYIDENYSTLADFFTVHYTTLYTNFKDNNFADELYRELRKRRILPVVPRKERQALEKAIARCQVKQIQLTLARIFSDWKASIEKPEGDQNPQP
jgi:hypothetical protein